nr:uncharacterized protein LOC116773386 [Danaus plexippus plexippus]
MLRMGCRLWLLTKEEGVGIRKWQERVKTGKGQPARTLIRRNAAIKDNLTPNFCERVVLPRSSQPMFKQWLDFVCLQETKWRGSKSRNIGDGYKLIYTESQRTRNGDTIGIRANSIEHLDNIIEIKHYSDRIMSVKVVVHGEVVNIVSAYARQVGCTKIDKDSFWNLLHVVLQEILQESLEQKGLSPTDLTFALTIIAKEHRGKESICFKFRQHVQECTLLCENNSRNDKINTFHRRGSSGFSSQSTVVNKTRRSGNGSLRMETAIAARKIDTVRCWRLLVSVNGLRTKYMVFNAHTSRTDPIVIDNQIVQQCDEYKYRSNIIDKSGNLMCGVTRLDMVRNEYVRGSCRWLSVVKPDMKSSDLLEDDVHDRAKWKKKIRRADPVTRWDKR